MLSSMLLMLWWCEGKGVVGEHRVGERGGEEEEEEVLLTAYNK